MPTIRISHRVFACVSSRLTWGAAVCAFALSSTPLAASIIEVSNLNQSSSFTAGVSGGTSVANIILAGKFTTDSHSYILAGAEAALNNGGNFGSATYEATLYSDAGSVPGSPLVIFDNHPTLASGNSQIVDFTTGSGLALDAFTSYWLGIKNTTGDNMAWNFTSSDAETSPDAWTIDNSAAALSQDYGASWTDGLYSGYVPLFAISVVPEPSTVTLAAFGLAALAAYGWRRKR